jgi:hypothetical protein
MTKRPIISSHADVRRQDYRFARQQQNPGQTDWEDRLPPMESLAEMVVGWGIIIITGGAAIELAWFLIGALKAQGILVAP